MNDDRFDPSEPKHAPYGPSRAEGYTTCLDYVNANEGLPDEQTEVAAEGTVAHEISDMCLKHGLSAYDFVGQRTRLGEWVFRWTEDDAFLLQRGIDETLELGGQFFGEQRVDISPWTVDGQFGTLDRMVIREVDGIWWIWIIDLKFGRGVAVSPVRNKQLMLYALGAWRDIALQILPDDAQIQFSLWIDQPRCPGGGGRWNCDLKTLLDFGDWIKERVRLSQLPNPPRTASDAGCRWCRRKVAPGGCDTFDNFNLELIGTDADQVDIIMDNPIVPARELTPERRSYILQHKKQIELWLERLEQEELQDALAGRPTPDRKAVVDTRKGTRDKWEDEKAAEDKLLPIFGEKIITKKLITPIQMRKKISSEDFEKHVKPHVKEGQHGHSMVPVEDARPAVRQLEFDEEDGE